MLTTHIKSQLLGVAMDASASDTLRTYCRISANRDPVDVVGEIEHLARIFGLLPDVDLADTYEDLDDQGVFLRDEEPGRVEAE